MRLVLANPNQQKLQDTPKPKVSVYKNSRKTLKKMRTSFQKNTISYKSYIQQEIKENRERSEKGRLTFFERGFESEQR